MTLSSIIPFPLWIISAALTIVVLLILFFFYAYWRKRQHAFLKDGGDVVELAARKQQLEADIIAVREWMEQQKAELQRLESERLEQEKVRAELTDLELRCQKQDVENEVLRKEVGDLENQKHLVSQTLERLKEEVGSIEANRDEAERLKQEILRMEARMEEVKAILGQVAESEIRLGTLQRAVNDMESEKNALGPALEELRSKAQLVKDELQTMLTESFRLHSERGQLDALMASLRENQQVLEGDIARLERRKTELESEVRTLGLSAREHAQKATEVERDLTAKLQRLERIRDQLEEKEKTLPALEVRKAVLEEEIERLQQQRPGEKSGGGRNAYSDLLQRRAACLREDEFSGRRTGDEYQALQQFKQALSNSRIYFPSRVIDAFHTSLKCQVINPLTVLAGVSGTGKTLLPVKYAEHMGLHSLVIPVQPRWDSPQDLFGFYNYLEKGYKATDLSRALVRMDGYNYDPKEFSRLGYDWPRERMLMVLLDEMNLARTEYYFSEFLSKLELRRLVENPANPAHREKAEIELDTGPGSERSLRIWVPENVLFVGTMNEDETTQTLSDKVLDRSNVLRFGKPDERHREQVSGVEETGSRPFLEYEQWRSWCRTVDEHAVWHDDVKKWIRSLNNGLEKVGRPFGYRVEDAIALYLANYPSVGQEDRYKLAFADQVEQKIIPKLRGLDVAESNTMNCLEDVAGVIGGLGDDALSGAFMSAKEESKLTGMFTWRGVTRTLEKG